MVTIYNNLDKNFKYLLLLPYIFWLLLIFFYIFNSDLIKAGELNGIVIYGNDSSRYINDAKDFLKLDFTGLHTSKISYIFFISVIFFFNLSLSNIHVATMSDGDFAHNEKSTTIEGATYVRIVHTDANGQVSILKDNIALEDKEIIDATFMSKNTLLSFLDVTVWRV